MRIALLQDGLSIASCVSFVMLLWADLAGHITLKTVSSATVKQRDTISRVTR